MTTVFLPMTAEAVRRFRDEGVLLHATGYSATPALRQARGFGPTADEDADYAAQTQAAVQSLLDQDGPRLVVAVDAPELRPTALAAWGQVEVPACSWKHVLAVFADDAEAAEARAAARAAVAGLPAGSDRIVAAAALPAVAELSAEHALLWYLPTELDDIVT